MLYELVNSSSEDTAEKSVNDGDNATSCGRLFKIRAAATVKNTMVTKCQIASYSSPLFPWSTQFFSICLRHNFNRMYTSFCLWSYHQGHESSKNHRSLSPRCICCLWYHRSLNSCATYIQLVWLEGYCCLFASIKYILLQVYCQH